MTSISIVSPAAADFLNDHSIKWQERAGLWGDMGTFRPASLSVDSLFDAVQPAPSVGSSSSAAAPVADESVAKARDEVLKDLRTLRVRSLLLAVSEHTTVVSASIDDAIVVAQAWPSELPAPCVEVDDDGKVSLEVLNEDGLAVGAIDFLGKDHVAAFSIVNGSSIAAAGKLNTASTTEVIQFFQNFNFLAA
ncbi:hypothetical protein [Sinirhodobacter huangdaonensis]|nr:hypothetical protein [Sinirhodobacter huangdaonensis]